MNLLNYDWLDWHYKHKKGAFIHDVATPLFVSTTGSISPLKTTQNSGNQGSKVMKFSQQPQKEMSFPGVFRQLLLQPRSVSSVQHTPWSVRHSLKSVTSFACGNRFCCTLLSTFLHTHWTCLR